MKKPKPDEELLSVLEEKEYKYIRPLGSGGSANVFLVQSLKYKDNFVAKQMFLDDPAQCKECEIRALQNLNSTSVISLYDYAITPHSLVMILEYCSHGSLEDYLKKNGPITGDFLRGLCRNILTGIDFIHQQRVAHLDIKPANILFDRYGRAKLADFGISRIFQGSNPRSNHKAGSIIFMAPEIINSLNYEPFRADIWALGVTFFIMNTARSPWPTQSYSAMMQAISLGDAVYSPNNCADLNKIIKTMLNPSPTQRPTAKQLLSNQFFNVSPKVGNIPLDLPKSGSSIKLNPISNIISKKTSTAHSTSHAVEFALRGKNRTLSTVNKTFPDVQTISEEN